MAFKPLITIAFFIAIFRSSIVAGQTTSTSIPSTTPINIDPFVTGKWGNPGARLHVCSKSLDAVHTFVADTIAESIEASTIADYSVNLGGGTLTIRSPRVSEAIFAKNGYDLIPSNRIRTRLYDGKLVAKGVWQFKKSINDVIGGIYEVKVEAMAMNATTQLGRTYDGKPIAQVVECKADLSRYRVEISYERHMFRALENCSLEACIKTRKYYEEAICKLFENFVKDVINRELQLYPTRVDVACEMHRVDYSLLNNEPNVTDQCVQAGLEGKYIWRSGSAVPFYPAELRWVENNRMLSFELADFAFNTLFYQAHIQGHRISAATLNSSSVQQALSFSCPDKQATTTTLSPARKYRGPAPKPRFVIGSTLTVGARKVACLGELSENFTSASGPAWQHVRQLTESDTGDIVYKTSQKANWIMVQSVNNAIFDGSNGVLEIYGKSDKAGNRQLLARVDIRSLRGEFTPKLNKANITGSIKITNLQLAPAPPQSRSINNEWLDKLAEFVAPILEEMYNDFLDKLAQYSIPLPAHYTCASPTFSVQPRTMQIDCDIERSTRRIIPVIVG